MAKAANEDIQHLTEFLHAVEEKVEDYEDIDYNWFHDAVRKVEPCWRLVVHGFEVLLSNAADPEKTYLDWKPSIKEALNIKPYAHELALCLANKKTWTPNTHPEIYNEWRTSGIGNYHEWLAQKILEQIM